MSKKASNPIDQYVGSRIRMQRLLLGMSQEKLADALKLTFQQVQKYEKGTNRVGASRLHHIATVLQVTPSFFFEGVVPATPGEKGGSKNPPVPNVVSGFLSTAEGLDLVKAFMQIKSRKLRRSIVDLVESIRSSATN